jgi:hypothetical protein
MVENQTSSVRLLIFCRNCGGLAAQPEFSSAEALLDVCQGAQELTDWPGRDAYVPVGQRIFAVSRPIMDRAEPPQVGAHGFCWQPADSEIRPIFHRCTSHLAVANTPASVVMPVTPVGLERPERILAGHHG